MSHPGHFGDAEREAQQQQCLSDHPHRSEMPSQTQVAPAHQASELSSVGTRLGDAEAPFMSDTFTYANLDQLEPMIPAPNEYPRIPTGSSVIEPDSVSDESGRWFHGFKEGKYFLPNDPAEQDRLDLQHHAFMLLLEGRLALAPMRDEPSSVIDVATGTGIWAMEFARQHPDTHVLGTDLSAIQPTSLPDNCEFIKEDSEEEWVFTLPDGNRRTFDYVHLRQVFTCFHDHRTVIRHAFQNLNPGGWIEFQDSAFSVLSLDGSADGTDLQRWADLCVEGAAVMGRDIVKSRYYKQWLIEAGFVDVVEKRYVLPGNTWPADRRLKEIGRYMCENTMIGARGAGWKMMRAAGLSPDEIEEVIRGLREEAPDPRHRWFFPFFVVYGRKPFAEETRAENSE